MSVPDHPMDDEGHPDLPTTDIEVTAHIHHGMAGSFPLRLAEFFFVSDGVFIAEYSKITPFFGLLAKQPGKDAMAMQAIYDRDGIDGVLLAADRLLWLNAGMLQRVKFVTGGWIGYPKITFYTNDHQSYAYRIHDTSQSFDEVASGLTEWGAATDVEMEIGDGLGITVRENIVRFFWQ